MSDSRLQSIRLRYGRGASFTCELDESRLAAFCAAPAGLGDIGAAVTEAVRQPIEFPPLQQCAFPGDRVALALDRDVPHSATLIAGIWGELEAAGIQPEEVLILQPADLLNAPLPDPRTQLPAAVRSALHWRIHDFDDKDGCGYLASSTGGDRLYLARPALDADVLITVGQIAYDSVIGYRGTNSVFYPGLSDREASQRAQGQGHSELGPDHERPLRTLADEMGWLVGTQFTVQTLPAAEGGVYEVLAGLNDSVLRRAKQTLSREWTARLDSRCNLVVAAIDGFGPGDAWRKLGAAVEAARGIVTRGGRIIVLSDIQADIGDGLQMLRDSAEPADALQPLRQIAPADMLPAIQLASAADWASVFLLSDLDPDLAEELFLTPIQHHEELLRLLRGESTCAMLESAEFVSARVAE